MNSFFKKIVNKMGLELMRKASQTWKETGSDPTVGNQPPRLLDFLQTYENHIWVYACVYAVSSSIAGVPFKIYKRKFNERLRIWESKEIESGEAYELFTKINPLRTRYDFWEESVAYGELTGNIYWEVVKDPRTGNPLELYALRPDRVEIIPDPKSLIGGYSYEINGRKINFTKEEVLQLRYFSPISELYGQGALRPANNSVTIDIYASIYNKNFFKNGAKIEGLLETDRSLTDAAYKRLKERWEQEYVGFKKAFRTAILEEGLKYKTTGTSHKDMDFYEQKKLNREEILAAFGVQPAIVGLFEFANYANVKEQKRLFWTETLLPKMKKIKESINAFLMPIFNKNLKAEERIYGDWDTAQIEALKEDEKTQTQIDRDLVDSGVSTINERRKLRNLPPVPWGDTWWVKGKRPAKDVQKDKIEESELEEKEEKEENPDWKLYQ